MRQSHLLAILISLAVSTARGTDFRDLPRDVVPQLTFGGAFIVPNEAGFAAYANATRDKGGALISVGTFRALMLASYGKFSEVVLFDVDPKVVAFNELQIEALKVAENVSEFLASIERLANGDLVVRARDYVERVSKLAVSDDGSGFMKNPDAYLRLRQLALDGKIHAVNGDLAGNSTLIAIGDRLRKKGVFISVFDVSNSLYYILGHKRDQELVENFGKLPFTRDAVVNFTSEIDGNPGRHWNSWSYYSVPARVYIRAANHFSSSRAAETAFAKTLFGTSADLTEKTCPVLFGGKRGGLK
ncbi:MAG: hypothetical protein V4760_05705 [Bdellovibrionota bacterium]